MPRVTRSKSMMWIAILALSGTLITACGSSAEQLNQKGNDAFAKQAYEQALETYQMAQIESPELAEPYYNAANALYREEKYVEALEQMQKALSFAKDEQLAESGLFNMGNTSYKTQEWEPAIGSYKQALLLNPDDQDAKYNLELALQRLQQQQQEQQQQEENQDQQQDQSENGEGQENQEHEQGQSQNGDQQQEQDQPQEGDRQQEQDQSQGGDRQQEQDQSQEGDQKQEQNQSQSSNPQEAGAEQQERQTQPGQMPSPGQRMTAEQARQLLEAIAQDSDTLQERLGQFYFVPTRPPVQDW